MEQPKMNQTTTQFGLKCIFIEVIAIIKDFNKKKLLELQEQTDNLREQYDHMNYSLEEFYEYVTKTKVESEIYFWIAFGIIMILAVISFFYYGEKIENLECYAYGKCIAPHANSVSGLGLQKGSWECIEWETYNTRKEISCDGTVLGVVANPEHWDLNSIKCNNKSATLRNITKEKCTKKAWVLKDYKN